MNLPNILTCLRFVLTVFFAFFLLNDFPGSRFFSLLFFTLAALTDLADGYLARKNNQITQFGKLMDPIADKFLMLTAFFGLVYLGLVPMWVAVVIAVREVFVTGLRFLFPDRADVSAGKAGKWKTVLQSAYIFAALLYIWVGATRVWNPDWGYKCWVLLNFLLAVALVLTVWSGIGYTVTYLKGKK